MDAPRGCWLSVRGESLTAITQESCCYELFWTSPGGSILQGNNCRDTYLSSRKPSKLDSQDSQGTAGEERVSDILLWNLSHGRARLGRPARTYLQQLCNDTGYCMKDLPKVMNDRDERRERVRENPWRWFEIL